MHKSSSIFYRAVFTGGLLVIVLAQVLWQHFNGGIISHHFLHRADMPAISNAWGIVVLPTLGWILTGFMERRSIATGNDSEIRSSLSLSVIAGFFGALLWGAALALSFSFGANHLSEILFKAIIALAILLPIYRSEYVLGFVIAMSFTFGAVLPLIIASPFVLISALLHLALYPLALRLFSRLRARG